MAEQTHILLSLNHTSPLSFSKLASRVRTLKIHLSEYNLVHHQRQGFKSANTIMGWNIRLSLWCNVVWKPNNEQYNRKLSIWQQDTRKPRGHSIQTDTLGYKSAWLGWTWCGYNQEGVHYPEVRKSVDKIVISCHKIVHLVQYAA